MRRGKVYVGMVGSGRISVKDERKRKIKQRNRYK